MSRAGKVVRFFEEHPLWGLPTGICTLALIAFLDLSTPEELSFSLFYLIPVALLFWFGGGAWPWVAAVAASLTWFADHLVHQRLNGAAVHQVGVDFAHATAQCAHASRGFGGVDHVHQREVGAGFGETQRGALAEAAARTGDHRHFSVQLELIEYHQASLSRGKESMSVNSWFSPPMPQQKA